MRWLKFHLILLFTSTAVLSSTLEPTAIDALTECPSAAKQVLLQIQTWAKHTYHQISDSEEVYGWMVEDRKRVPYYCYEQCGCVRKKMAEGISLSRIDSFVSEIYGLTLQGGEGILPVEIKMAGGNVASYAYHQATLIKLAHFECYAIIDPIMDSSKVLFSPKCWVEKIQSRHENRVTKWLVKKSAVKP